MKRQFAVFDLDGTLVRWQLYHAIVDKLADAGQIDPIDFSEVIDARLRWKKRETGTTFRTYELVLINAYENALKTLTTQQFDEAVDAAFDEHKEQVYIYTRELIRDLKTKGYVLLAISGSHAEAVQKIANHYGFDDSAGTIYHRSKETFTGEKTFVAHDKKQTLTNLIKKHGLSLRGSIGVGDSEGDILMLEMVQRPIAFNPSSGLLEHAQSKGWEIVVERKNVIYKLNQENNKYTLKN